MKQLIGGTAFTTVSILAALSLGAAAPNGQGCGDDDSQAGTTTTTSGDYPTNGSNDPNAPNSGTAGGANPDNSGYGTLPMPNARTPLTSYDQQDQSGVNATSSNGQNYSGGGTVVSVDPGLEANLNANGASQTSRAVSSTTNPSGYPTVSNATNGNAQVAPIETNGYGQTPIVNSNAANQSSANVSRNAGNTVINGTNSGSTDQSGIPISTTQANTGANGVNGSSGGSFGTTTNGPQNSTPATGQATPSVPQQNQAQQQHQMQTGANR